MSTPQTTLYPQGPANVPADLTAPTKAYKQRAWLAVASLLVFVILYVALSAWFVWTAYRLISDAIAGGESPFLSWMIGGCAAFLAVFMLKALFFVKQGGSSGDIEITPSEQPRLFEFLHRLADEAGAPRPAKVYLSPRVNAAVFYDLSVLNLLVPSRKNLEIGLALVNVLTLSELKAVLAHEFGHFAQRSMAIGSWVYIAQQIASQIIAKRDMLDKFLRGLSSTDIRLAWLGWLLSLIVWSIRSLLDSLLSLVILAQRALSRQMEFQADLVAVSLTGSDELVHALHKLQAADDAWQSTLNFASGELNKERKPADLFAIQTEIIAKLGVILNDEDYGKVPKTAAENVASRRIFKSSFAQPPQMWATHPANTDREENAKRVYLQAPHDARSAWTLFDDIEKIKANMLSQIFGEVKAAPVANEDTLAALDESYALLQYHTRYRGAYINRPLTRHAQEATALYSPAPQIGDIHTALDALYPAQLSDELQQLRELKEEKATLKALHDKVYKTTGENIVFRGEVISRKDLPSAIEKVNQELESAQQGIISHDKACRSAHLAAAEKLGNGWPAYLQGLIATLHYAEHSHANLLDAHGLMRNVLAVVTADGKVSAKELKRLITACNQLHGELHALHAHKAYVTLDTLLANKLNEETKALTWSEALEVLNLPPAANENINEWLQVIDNWVNSYAGSLATLKEITLEQLLKTEHNIALLVKKDAGLNAAPTPSSVPAQFNTLVLGRERKRQERLGWWDRFQTADGMVPAVARLGVAGAIVAGVLGFSNITGGSNGLSIYNGLDRPVQITISHAPNNDKILNVAPHSAESLEVELNEQSTVEARTIDNKVIEQFKPLLADHTQHYIYNVASASPLVEWVASYGNAAKVQDKFLGAPQWTTASVDHYFSEPPESVSTKSGGDTRSVLSGVSQAKPEEMLSLLLTEADRKHMIETHLKWDNPNTPSMQAWQKIATGEPQASTESTP